MSSLKPRENGADVRVMSSNILFDRSLEGRVPLISAYYRSSDADLIGMQEVNSVGEKLFAEIADIYTPVATTHADQKRCFTPILYRHDRLDLVEYGSELYNMRGTDTKSMAWAVVRNKETGKMTALINSHGSLILAAYKLEATDEVEGEMWRVDNVRQMLEKKDQLREKYGEKLPVFITGDFNTYAHCESIQNMKKVMADSADVATVSSMQGGTTFHPVGKPGRAGETIDFVFVSDDSVDVLVHFIATDETALAISDHSPVFADAILK